MNHLSDIVSSLLSSELRLQSLTEFSQTRDYRCGSISKTSRVRLVESCKCNLALRRRLRELRRKNAPTKRGVVVFEKGSLSIPTPSPTCPWRIPTEAEI